MPMQGMLTQTILPVPNIKPYFVLYMYVWARYSPSATVCQRIDGGAEAVKQPEAPESFFKRIPT